MVNGMSNETETSPQLFVLRLWPVQLPDGRVEWRGRLHHAQTNETRYFRDWPALIPSLLVMLRESHSIPGESPILPLLMEVPHDDTEIG
jgi:hypothetical protein